MDKNFATNCNLPNKHKSPTISTLFSMKKILPFFILTFLIAAPSGALAQEITSVNAGFVGSIWYSNNKIVAGDKIRVYSAIQNQTNYDIVGIVELYDNGELNGTTSFSLVKGSLAQSWIDWTAASGKHQLYEKITQAKKWEVGKDPVPINIQFGESNTDLQEIFNPPPAITSSTAEIKKDEVSPNPGVGSSTAPSSSPGVGGEPISPSSTIGEKTHSIINTVGEKTTEAWNSTGNKVYESVINSLSNLLTQKQAELDKQIAERTSPPLLQKQLEEMDKKSEYLKIPSEKAPTINHVYKWILGVALYIINTWWIFTIIILLVARAIFKIGKKLWPRTKQDEN